MGDDGAEKESDDEILALRDWKKRRAAWKPPNWTLTQAPIPINGVNVPL